MIRWGIRNLSYSCLNPTQTQRNTLYISLKHQCLWLSAVSDTLVIRIDSMFCSRRAFGPRKWPHQKKKRKKRQDLAFVQMAEMAYIYAYLTRTSCRYADYRRCQSEARAEVMWHRREDMGKCLRQASMT